MNFLFSILLILSPLFLLSQEEELANSLWCFEANFLDSLSVGEIVEVDIFFFDNDPIQFKKNGKFKRIDAPINMSGNTPKSKRIDDLKGHWSLNKDTLIMQIKEKSIEFKLIQKTENQMILKVIKESGSK